VTFFNFFYYLLQHLSGLAADKDVTHLASQGVPDIGSMAADPVAEAVVLSNIRVCTQSCELLLVIAHRAPFLPCYLDSPYGSPGAPETDLSSD
jgi:hypothetical protein